MTIIVWTYACYLALSVAITVWVASTLSRHGRVFLLKVFHGVAARADAVNRLLVVGFYLVNLAGVLFNLKACGLVSAPVESLNFMASKIGIVLTVLGVMHFNNMIVLAAISRRRAHSLA